MSIFFKNTSITDSSIRFEKVPLNSPQSKKPKLRTCSWIVSLFYETIQCSEGRVRVKDLVNYIKSYYVPKALDDRGENARIKSIVHEWKRTINRISQSSTMYPSLKDTIESTLSKLNIQPTKELLNILHQERIEAKKLLHTLEILLRDIFYVTGKNHQHDAFLNTAMDIQYLIERIGHASTLNEYDQINYLSRLRKEIDLFLANNQLILDNVNKQFELFRQEKYRKLTTNGISLIENEAKDNLIKIQTAIQNLPQAEKSVYSEMDRQISHLFKNASHLHVNDLQDRVRNVSQTLREVHDFFYENYDAIITLSDLKQRLDSSESILSTVIESFFSIIGLGTQDSSQTQSLKEELQLEQFVKNMQQLLESFEFFSRNPVVNSLIRAERAVEESGGHREFDSNKARRVGLGKIREELNKLMSADIQANSNMSQIRDECFNLLDNFLSPLELEGEVVVSSTDTGFSIEIPCLQTFRGEFPDNTRLPYDLMILPQSGKICFQIFKNGSEVAVKVFEHIQMKKGDEAKINRILNTLPGRSITTGFIDIRGAAKENMKQVEDDPLIKFQQFTFFLSQQDGVCIKAERNVIDSDTWRQAVDAAKKSLRANLNYERFARSAVNWGKMLLFPELGGKALLINKLFRTQNPADPESGRVTWHRESD